MAHAVSPLEVFICTHHVRFRIGESRFHQHSREGVAHFRGCGRGCPTPSKGKSVSTTAKSRGFGLPRKAGRSTYRKAPLGPLTSGKPRWGFVIGYSNNLLCARSRSSCSRIYFRSDFSSRPTVLTQYPVAQKCRPTIRRSCISSRCILTALFPFRNPIVYHCCPRQIGSPKALLTSLNLRR